VSGNGQLAPGDYTWTGFVYVPTSDTYTFRFQFSSAVPASDVTFTMDGAAQPLSTAADVYGTGVTSAHSAAARHPLPSHHPYRSLPLGAGLPYQVKPVTRIVTF
jgi:hypothetical protein